MGKTKSLESVVKPASPSEVVRNYLVLRAEKMTEHPEAFTQEEGKALDRALRSCPAITDIDTVWVKWRFVAEKFGWLTDNELVFGYKSGYYYPNQNENH